MKVRFWKQRFVIGLTTVAVVLGMANPAFSTDVAGSSVAVPGTNTPLVVANGTATTNAPALKVVGPVPAKVSPGLSDIVELAQSGVDQSVILSYINNSLKTYHPTSSDIIYLRDIGLSSEVISALINHTGESPQETSSASVQVSSQPAVTTTTGAPVLPAPAAPPAVSSSAEAISPSSTSPPPVSSSTSTPVPNAPPAQPATVEPFYSDLAPYGAWMDIPGYGWCWQPTSVTVDPFWKPYCNDGYWLDSDYGMYWNSSYSWGWAPFHYGRWFFYAPYGWLWYPGTVWGPSWVCWRYTPDYCGWAPLPPGANFESGFGLMYDGGLVGYDFDFGLPSFCFTFVSFHHFFDDHPFHHFLDRDHARDIFHHSRGSDRFFEGPDHRIMNRGMGRDLFPASMRSEIRKVDVRTLPPAAGGRFVGVERPERVGNSLVIYRRQLQMSVPRNASEARFAPTSRIEREARGISAPSQVRSPAFQPRQANLFEKGGSAIERQSQRITSAPSLTGRQPGTRLAEPQVARNQTVFPGQNARIERPGEITGRQFNFNRPLSPPSPSERPGQVRSFRSPASSIPQTPSPQFHAMPAGPRPSREGNAFGSRAELPPLERLPGQSVNNEPRWTTIPSKPSPFGLNHAVGPERGNSLSPGSPSLIQPAPEQRQFSFPTYRFNSTPFPRQEAPSFRTPERFGPVFSSPSFSRSPSFEPRSSWHPSFSPSPSYRSTLPMITQPRPAGPTPTFHGGFGGGFRGGFHGGFRGGGSFSGPRGSGGHRG
ncbi:MAG: hypothetical protein M1608_16260 [Candidatus Omnitrophica bacterium]|nr:hypothetical protein [Candidatus Omnitrophota bacterium]